MNMMVILWLGAVVVFVVIEALTVQLVCIWFAASALVSLVVALLGAPEWAQIVVFCVCTALLLIFTRPIVKRLMQKPRTMTNSDRILGKPAIVTQEINNDMAQGHIKVSGQVWTARSQNGEIYPIEKRVIIRSIEGVKAIVERL